MRVVFAGTPRGRGALTGRAAAVRARGGRRCHPAGRTGRPGPAAGTERGGRACCGGRPGGAQARPAARRRFHRPAAAIATRLLPGHRVRRADPAGGAGHRTVRLGKPAFLAAARMAGSGAGAARHPARGRHHRGDHLPPRRGTGRGPGLRRGHRADRPPGHGRRAAGRTGGIGRRAARRYAGRNRVRPAGGAARSQPRGSATHPRSRPRMRGSAGTVQPWRSDRQIRACTPAPGRVDRAGSGQAQALAAGGRRARPRRPARWP